MSIVLLAVSALADGLTTGKTAYSNGDMEQAIHEFERAVAVNQKDFRAHLWLARAIGRKAQKLGAPLAAFLVRDVRHNLERAVQIAPGNLDARHDLLAFYLEAPWIMGGGMDKARAQAAAIRGLSPADGLWADAKIAEKQKDYARAERNLQAALAADPKRPLRSRELGRFYDRRGRWPEAEAAFLKAGDPESHYLLAEAYLKRGWKVPEAERLLKSFLAAPPPEPGDEPTRAQAHLLLGRTYVRLQRKNDAATEFRAALHENPRMAEAGSALAALK